MVSPFLINKDPTQLLDKLQSLFIGKNPKYKTLKKVLEIIKNTSNSEGRNYSISLFLENSTYTCLENFFLSLVQLLFTLKSNKLLEIHLLETGMSSGVKRCQMMILNMIEILVEIFWNRVTYRSSIGVTMEYMNKSIFDSILIFLETFNYDFKTLKFLKKNSKIIIEKNSEGKIEKFKSLLLAKNMMKLVDEVCRFKGNFENVALYVFDLLTYDKTFKSPILYFLQRNIIESSKNKISQPKVVKIIKDVFFKECQIVEPNSALIAFYGEKRYLNFDKEIRPLSRSFVKKNFDLIFDFCMEKNKNLKGEFLEICNSLINFGSYSLMKKFFKSVMRSFELRYSSSLSELYAKLLKNKLFKFFNIYKDNFLDLMKIFETKLKNEKKSSSELLKIRVNFFEITKNLFWTQRYETDAQIGSMNKNFTTKIAKFVFKQIKKIEFKKNFKYLEKTLELIFWIFYRNSEHVLDYFSGKNSLNLKFIFNALKRELESEKQTNGRNFMLYFMVIFQLFDKNISSSNFKKIKEEIFWFFIETKKKNQFLRKLENILKLLKKSKFVEEKDRRVSRKSVVEMCVFLFEKIKKFCDKDQSKSKRAQKSEKTEEFKFLQFLEEIDSQNYQYEKFDLDFFSDPSCIQTSFLTLKNQLENEKNYEMKNYYLNEKNSNDFDIGMKIEKESENCMKERDLKGFELHPEVINKIKEYCKNELKITKKENQRKRKNDTKIIDIFVKFQSPKKKKNVINLVNSASSKKKPKKEFLPSFVTLVKHESFQKKEPPGHNSLPLRRTNSASKAVSKRNNFPEKSKFSSQIKPQHQKPYLGRRQLPVNPPNNIQPFFNKNNKKLKIGKNFNNYGNNMNPQIYQNYNNFNPNIQPQRGFSGQIMPNQVLYNKPHILNPGQVNPHGMNFGYQRTPNFTQNFPMNNPPQFPPQQKFLQQNFQNSNKQTLSKEEIKALTSLASQYQKNK